MSDAVEVYSPEMKWCLRIHSMITEEGTEVLRKCLTYNLLVHGMDIDGVLSQASISQRINHALQKKILKQDQFDILYNNGPVVIENQDVTMLTFLIRYLHPSIAINNPVWINPPITNLSVEADIIRLREIRNKWCHRGSGTMTENEFYKEFHELKIILCRIARNIGGTELTSADISNKLENKKLSKFDVQHKPLQADMSTSTTSSLDRRDDELTEVLSSTTSSLDCRDDELIEVLSSTTSSLDRRDELIEVLSSTTSSLDRRDELIEVLSSTTSSLDRRDDGLIEVLSKDTATSTGSLDKKRKLSFRVKSALQPFVMMPRKTSITCTDDQPQLPKRIKDKHSVKRSSNCGDCSCTIKTSAKNQEPVIIKTKDEHCAFQHRCRVDGISFIGKEHMLISDLSHDRIQVIDTSQKLISEYQCESPRGMCNMNHQTVAVVLEKQSKIDLISLNEDNKIVTKGHIDIPCQNWHYDIKKGNGANIYILCETGDIHCIDVKSKAEKGSIKTGINFVTYFDVSKDGDRFYLSSDKAVYCVDWLGSIMWRFERTTVRGGSHDTYRGIVLHKKRLFVSLWNADGVAELSLSGKMTRTVLHKHVQCPWTLAMWKNRLCVSQFMSEIHESTCQEIVILEV